MNQQQLIEDRANECVRIMQESGIPDANKISVSDLVSAYKSGATWMASQSYSREEVATLIEVIIRGKLWFPKDDAQMKWFDEGLNVVGDTDIMKKLDAVINSFTEKQSK